MLPCAVAWRGFFFAPAAETHGQIRKRSSDCTIHGSCYHTQVGQNMKVLDSRRGSRSHNCSSKNTDTISNQSTFGIPNNSLFHNQQRFQWTRPYSLKERIFELRKDAKQYTGNEYILVPHYLEDSHPPEYLLRQNFGVLSFWQRVGD